MLLNTHPLLVSWSRKSRAIPLLPVWALQSVQSISACTTVHFTFTYTSTPLWAVRPVQSLSACTTVDFTFTYTSTPPMCRTACTEPQCLYMGALYLYLYCTSISEDMDLHQDFCEGFKCHHIDCLGYKYLPMQSWLIYVMFDRTESTNSQLL